MDQAKNVCSLFIFGENIGHRLFAIKNNTCSKNNASLVEVNKEQNACLVEVEGKFYNCYISMALFSSLRLLFKLLLDLIKEVFVRHDVNAQHGQ